MEKIEVKQFTIKRSEWGRGTGSGRLFSSKHVTPQRCCLGFLGNACGISDEMMEHQGSPTGLMIGPNGCNLGANPEQFGKWGAWPDFLFRQKSIDDDCQCEDCRNGPRRGWTSSMYQDELMNINDMKGLPEPDRERKIAEIFAKHGIVVEFVD